MPILFFEGGELAATFVGCKGDFFFFFFVEHVPPL